MSEDELTGFLHQLSLRGAFKVANGRIVYGPPIEPAEGI
jgi:hypothetical protein